MPYCGRKWREMYSFQNEFMAARMRYSEDIKGDSKNYAIFLERTPHPTKLALATRGITPSILGPTSSREIITSWSTTTSRWGRRKRSGERALRGVPLRDKKAVSFKPAATCENYENHSPICSFSLMHQRKDTHTHARRSTSSNGSKIFYIHKNCDNVNTNNY